MIAGDGLLIKKDGGGMARFVRCAIEAGSEFDEKWLQERLFEEISLLNVIDPVYDKIKIIPLCREFTMHDSIRNVYLDILAVTETGKLILVECKLWKNPQARREVLAQIIEYATLLQSLSYSDLVSKLKKHIPSGDKDPIVFQLERYGIDLDEGVLIDRVSDSLKGGNFQLVIAGDGIRSDLVNLTRSSNFTGSLADLCLLEISIYQNSNGDTLLIPVVPVKTETITKTVLLTSEGMPAIVEEDQEGISRSGSQPRQDEAARTRNREFWDQFIKVMEFDHPDQERPRHGGNNWARVPFPEPFGWITAYRQKDRIGVFCRVNPDQALDAQQFFENYKQQLRDEINPELRFEFEEKRKGWGNGFHISVHKVIDTLDDSTLEEQITWFSDTLNAYVNVLRPLVRNYNE